MDILSSDTHRKTIVVWFVDEHMKLGIILSSNQAETNWNAFRLANLAITKGDTVTIFLSGEGVEYEKNSSPQFNIKEQVEKFLQSEAGTILACGACMAIRKQGSTKECPESGIEELYSLVSSSDKVLTF